MESDNPTIDETSRSSRRSIPRTRRRFRNLLLEPLEARWLLATITVDSLDDNMLGDGDITLREAIHAANTDTSVDGSPAGSGADTIEFDPGLLLPGTITLGGTQLEITEDLTITGPGSTIRSEAAE